MKGNKHKAKKDKALSGIMKKDRHKPGKSQTWSIKFKGPILTKNESY